MFSDLIYTKRIEKLRNTYENVGDIDLYVGMVMETPKDDALIGDTFLCLIGDTFARIKYGDRFFYDLEGQAGSFTIGTCIEITNIPVIAITSKIFAILCKNANNFFLIDQLDQIRKASLARVICDNSKLINEIHPLVMRPPNSETYACRLQVFKI